MHTYMDAWVPYDRMNYPKRSLHWKYRTSLELFSTTVFYLLVSFYGPRQMPDARSLLRAWISKSYRPGRKFSNQGGSSLGASPSLIVMGLIYIEKYNWEEIPIFSAWSHLRSQRLNNLFPNDVFIAFFSSFSQGYLNMQYILRSMKSV